MIRKFLLIPLLVISACSARTVVSAVSNAWTSGDIHVFLAGFEAAAMSHDDAAIMHFFDNSYIQEQMVVNLEGRREQFLNELFGGNFKEILTVRATVLPDRADPSQPLAATILVTFKSGIQQTMHMDLVWAQRGGRTFALRGPMG